MPASCQGPVVADVEARKGALDAKDAGEVQRGAHSRLEAFEGVE